MLSSLHIFDHLIVIKAWSMGVIFMLISQIKKVSCRAGGSLTQDHAVIVAKSDSVTPQPQCCMTKEF